MNIKINIDFDEEIKNLKTVMLETGWESILKNSKKINNSLEKN